MILQSGQSTGPATICSFEASELQLLHTDLLQFLHLCIRKLSFILPQFTHGSMMYVLWFKLYI